MRLFTFTAFVAGLALFAALLLYYGAGEIAAGVAAVGWGLLWISLYRFVTITAHTLGWRALFAGDARPGLLPLLRARWIGEAVNSLLPVAQLGGDLARAQMAARMEDAHGKTRIGGATAGATVVVDIAAGLVTQLVFTAFGFALLMPWLGPSPATNGELRGWLAGVTIAVVAIGTLFLAARSGWLGSFIRRSAAGRGATWDALAGGITTLEARTAELYRQRRALAACFTWRLFAWLLHVGETWLALYFLGAPAGLPVAIVIESLSSAVRSGAFAVPAGLGVQEGGFVLIGAMVGLPAETALALALVKRVRELAVGLPGLLAWTAAGGKSLMQVAAKRAPGSIKQG